MELLQGGAQITPLQHVLVGQLQQGSAGSRAAPSTSRPRLYSVRRIDKTPARGSSIFGTIYRTVTEQSVAAVMNADAQMQCRPSRRAGQTQNTKGQVSPCPSLTHAAGTHFYRGSLLKRLHLNLAGSRGPPCGVPLSAIVLKSTAGRREEAVEFKFRTQNSPSWIRCSRRCNLNRAVPTCTCRLNSHSRPTLLYIFYIYVNYIYMYIYRIRFKTYDPMFKMRYLSISKCLN